MDFWLLSIIQQRPQFLPTAVAPSVNEIEINELVLVYLMPSISILRRVVTVVFYCLIYARHAFDLPMGSVQIFICEISFYLSFDSAWIILLALEAWPSPVNWLVFSVTADCQKKNVRCATLTSRRRSNHAERGDNRFARCLCTTAKLCWRRQPC